MRIVRGAYFWPFGSIASLPTETTDGEILVAFLAETWPQKRSQSAKFFLGGHALPCSHLRTRNGRTSPK